MAEPNDISHTPKTCYMCNKTATSLEHVPPQFLFPEEKDLPIGTLLRKNLLTVPSCDEHNSQKSKDDEYLVYALVACQGSNDVGQEHFKSKIWRAIKRRPALINHMLQNSAISFIRESGNDEWHETIRVEIDEQRFYGALEKIARAIYYHHWRKKAPQLVDVWPHFLTRIGAAGSGMVGAGSVILDSTDRLFREAVKHGDNPEVFFYNAHWENDTTAVVRLTFYSGLSVTAIFRPSTP